MTQITLKGNKINTVGKLPAVGTMAPDFIATKTDLSEVHLKDFLGKNIILSIFPSLDTPTCAKAVHQFNDDASKVKNTVVLCISADLPFAHSRFCTTQGINNVTPLSVFRHKEFGDIYGVKIVDGPIAGLLSRAIIVLDPQGKILYTEQVPEIAEEPNYQAALQAVSQT